MRLRRSAAEIEVCVLSISSMAGPQRRVQNGHRLLKVHRDLAGAVVAHLLRGKPKQIDTVQKELAGRDLRRRFSQ